MRLYPETQAIWKTLKLALSLFDDTFRQNPKQTIWNLTPRCNLLAMLFFQASVLIWISCMNPCIPPLRPSQTFVRRPLINLERLLPYPLISFHFIWMTENEAFQVLLFGKIRLWLSVSFLRFQHVKFHESRDLWFLLLEWKFFSAFSFFPFLLKKKNVVGFSAQKAWGHVMPVFLWYEFRA